MFSKRQKLAGAALTFALMSTAGVAVTGSAHAAGGGMCHGQWVNGLTRCGYYADMSPRWNWGRAWQACGNAKSVKFVGAEWAYVEEYHVWYGCSDSTRP